MNEEELLKVYIKELEALALEHLHERNISALQAIREALNIIEGQMTGY